MNRSLIGAGLAGLGGLALLRWRSDSRPVNRAYVFLHPAVSSKAHLTKKYLSENGLRIRAHRTIDSDTIHRKLLIDRFNVAVASKAMYQCPLPELTQEDGDMFQSRFSIRWEHALSLDLIMNAKEACHELGCSSDELYDAWNEAQKQNQIVEFSRTFRCGYVNMPGVGPNLERRKSLFVINGDYLHHRDMFLSHGCLHYFEVEWEAANLSWNVFNETIIGSSSKPDSLQGKLGETDANALHASASAFEGFANRKAWLGTRCREDSHCRNLLAAGVREQTLEHWIGDPEIQLPTGGKGTVFGALRGTDSITGIKAAVQLQALQ